MIHRLVLAVPSNAVLAVATATASLAATTALVWALEDFVGIPNASSAYLLAVVAAGVIAGTGAAVSAAVGAFLLYNFLFIRPIHTLLVADPEEWLTLLLLLFVGVVVGRLAAGQRERADAAARREREAVATFRISHTLALAASTHEALPTLVRIIAAETSYSRVWVTLGTDDATERTAADSGEGDVPASATTSVLVRRPADEPAEWVRVHAASRSPRRATEERVHRVFIESGGHRLGSIWALREGRAGVPTREETRLVSAAADQIARGVERDGLADEAVNAEVARRSDALKTALLESVSHDLRTPLAAIRAAAGGLADPAVSWLPDEVRAVAVSIDRDADRLSSLVANLLDLSRIEGGALRPEREPFVLADLVVDAVDRLRPRLEGHPLTVDVAADLPLVLVDPVYVDQALTNLVENAVRHAGDDAAILVTAAHRVSEPTIRLVVEDGGAGVAEEFLPRLFERFFRVARPHEGSRRGTGIGLAVVRGLIEATGGTVTARRSDLGGLAIELALPVTTSGATESAVAGPAPAEPNGHPPSLDAPVPSSVPGAAGRRRPPRPVARDS